MFGVRWVFLWRPYALRRLISSLVFLLYYFYLLFNFAASSVGRWLVTGRHTPHTESCHSMRSRATQNCVVEISHRRKNARLAFASASAFVASRRGEECAIEAMKTFTFLCIVVHFTNFTLFCSPMFALLRWKVLYGFLLDLLVAAWMCGFMAGAPSLLPYSCRLYSSANCGNGGSHLVYAG